MDNIPAYLEAENKYVFYLLVSQIKQQIELFIMSQQEQQELLWSETSIRLQFRFINKLKYPLMKLNDSGPYIFPLLQLLFPML